MIMPLINKKYVKFVMKTINYVYTLYNFPT